MNAHFDQWIFHSQLTIKFVLKLFAYIMFDTCEVVNEKTIFLSKRASFFLQPAQRKVFQSIPSFLSAFLFLVSKVFFHPSRSSHWLKRSKEEIQCLQFSFRLQSVFLSIFPSSLYLYTSTLASVSQSMSPPLYTNHSPLFIVLFGVLLSLLFFAKIFCIV